MKTIKKVISSALISVGVSLAIFTLVGMIFDLRGGGTFTLEGYGFTKMVLACIVTGLGFGVPSVLYSSEKLSPVLATVIHLGIGMAVYFTAASLVGWIPFEAGMTATFLVIAGDVLITLIIWACFMKYNKDLAERMNRALQKRRD